MEKMIYCNVSYNMLAKKSQTNTRNKIQKVFEGILIKKSLF